MDKSLGKLTKVELREYWKDEAKDFTPWLAKEENLDLLGEAIQMELELVGTEQSVGNFKVDIVAKEKNSINSDQYIVIENQLEKTNHDHLGKLLTYGAGRSAKAMIWIALKLKEEHRKTLDWLNENTNEDVNFFGLEIELWRIGDSKPAPQFNLVSQPNEWAKVMAQQDKISQLGELQFLQQEFWKGFTEYMSSHKSFLHFRDPKAQNWLNFPIGKSGFNGLLTVDSKSKKISCELYIQNNAPAFISLKTDKELIEKELNTKLKWKEQSHLIHSRIAQYKAADFQDKESWEELFKWLKERSEAFYKAFHKRLQNLDSIYDLGA